MTPQLANIIAMDQVNDETLALHQSLVKKRREERKTNEEVNEAYKKKELEMFQKSIENSWADRNKRTEVEQQTRKEEDAELLLLVSAKKRNMSTAKKSLDPLVTHERSAAASEIGRTVLRFEADNPPPTVGAAPPSLQELAPVATGGGVPLVPAAAPWQSNPSAAMAFAPWQHNHSPLFIGGLDQATIEAAYFAEFGNNGSNNKEEYCNKEVGVDEGDAEESSQEESSQEDQEDEEDDGFGSDDSSDSALLGLPPAASKRTSSPLAPKPKATVRAAAPKPKATAPRAQKRKAMAPVQATSVAGPPQKKKTKRELRIEAMAKAKVLMAQDKEQVENNKARQRAAVVPAMPRTEVWEEDALKGMKNAELRIILKGMSVPTKEKWTKAYLTKLILAEQCLE